MKKPQDPPLRIVSNRVSPEREFPEQERMPKKQLDIAKELTQEEEIFCIEFVKHGNIARAYRAAKPGVQHVSFAGAWIRRAHIQARITELRKAMRDLSVVTLQTHLTDLAEIRDEARSEGKFAAAVSAEIARGRAGGLYNHKKTVDHLFPQLQNMSSEDIARQLQELENTHTKLLEHQPNGPDGSVLIDTGEFEDTGTQEEIIEGTTEEETGQ